MAIIGGIPYFQTNPHQSASNLLQHVWLPRTFLSRALWNRNFSVPVSLLPNYIAQSLSIIYERAPYAARGWEFDLRHPTTGAICKSQSYQQRKWNMWAMPSAPSSSIGWAQASHIVYPLDYMSVFHHYTPWVHIFHHYTPGKPVGVGKSIFHHEATWVFRVGSGRHRVQQVRIMLAPLQVQTCWNGLITTWWPAMFSSAHPCSIWAEHGWEASISPWACRLSARSLLWISPCTSMPQVASPNIHWCVVLFNINLEPVVPWQKGNNKTGLTLDYTRKGLDIGLLGHITKSQLKSMTCSSMAQPKYRTAHDTWPVAPQGSMVTRQIRRRNTGRPHQPWVMPAPRWRCRKWRKPLSLRKIYRKPPYLMVKTMVSCRFSLKPIQWYYFFEI